MKLTAKQVQAARFEGRPRKLFDGRGLYLHVTKTGRKWRYKYRLDGREKVFTIGDAELVSLAEARERHREAYKLVSQGLDPVQGRRAAAQARAAAIDAQARRVPNVGEVVDEWCQRKGYQIGTGDKVVSRLRQLRSEFRSLPITDVDAVQVLEELEAMIGRVSSDHAYRVHGYLIKAFDAKLDDPRIAGGTFVANPAKHPLIKRNLPKRQDWKRFAHTTRPDELADVLTKIEFAVARPETASCLWLQPRLFLRPSELRNLAWDEVNFADSQLEIRAERMKGRREHLVPLARQCQERLERMYWERRSDYVFPSPQKAKGDRPLSNQAINKALVQCGVPTNVQVPHGFRHTASTSLNEREFEHGGHALRFSADVIEAQLAHKVTSVRATYNRAEYLSERRVMMQAYADWLDSLVIVGSTTRTSRLSSIQSSTSSSNQRHLAEGLGVTRNGAGNFPFCQ